MKRSHRIIVYLVALGLLLQSAVIWGAPSERSRETATILAGLLDPDSQITQPVKKAVSDGLPDLALAIFRDHLVKKLRETDFGQFLWHDYKLNPRQQALADYLVGRLPAKGYLDKVSGGTIDFWDIYGMAGTPDTGKTIYWTEKAINPPGSVDYASFIFTIPLAARYWQTRDEIFMRKWFDIASGFARDQKHSAELLEPAVRKKFFCGWTIDTGQMLAMGDRAQNIIRCLAVFAKNLPSDTRGTDWEKVLQPSQSPWKEGLADSIPANELADIAISLVRDYPALLLEKYGESGKAPPNQRRNGLMALTMLAQVFSDFKTMRDLRSRLAAAWQDYSDAAFFPDGGMLEQSFNYNDNDAAQLEMMFEMIGPQDLEWLDSLRQRIEKFRKMEGALKMPGRSGLPQVGNNHAAHKAPDEIATTNSQQPAFDFTSVAFPFSGYYVLRDGWIAGDLYLFLNGARPAAGHHMRDRNSIQVFAFNRLLLCCSGPPDYFGKLPKDIQQYLSEDSSWKANTILVDGKSQTSAFGVATRTEKSPVPGRWLSSGNFDFVESIHDTGYGEPFDKYRKGPQNIFTDVQHRREVLFVRPEKLWIVTDLILNTSGVEHGYTQVWHFPPLPGGFREEDVETDEKIYLIHTKETGRPNLWIYQAGIPDLRYSKYFGSKQPCFGWHACGIGKAVPAAEVHADWRFSNDQILVSVIIPSKGAGSPVIAFERYIPKEKVGFTMQLEDGSRITYQTSRSVEQMDIAGIQARATTLAVLEGKDGELSGVVMGCRDIKAGGSAQKIPGPDFAFRAGKDKIYDVQPFQAP